MLPHPRRIAPSLIALAIAAVSLLAAVAPAPSRAQTAAAGTPVLGAPLLNATQLAGWYTATGIRSTSPTDVSTLARLFIEEGTAQGVRGDIAFAQSMLETGYLRYGGQVVPSDNNFSGLGACDSCRRGLAFASATLGVRAQIQHLWAYAAPAATTAGLARPNADIRFSLVQPKGKAPLWEQMGAGNWATDPDYAGKVLSIWHSMLKWAGVASPTPATVPGAAPAVRTLRTSSGGGGWLGTWALHRSGVSGAITEFGEASSARRAGSVCLMRWATIGVAVLAAGTDPCATEGSTARWARLSHPLWRTSRGLAVGDSAARLARLYPHTRRRGTQRWLVWGRNPGTRTVKPRLRAEIKNGKVRAFIVNARKPTA